MKRSSSAVLSRAMRSSVVILGALVALLCVLFINSFLTPPLHAQSTQGFTGYAWSGNTGWINMSGVTVNNDNTLAGYAWGGSAGWINFGSNPSCGAAPTINPSTKALSGFARAINGVSSDGCISLSGSGYGVVLNGASTYAWASDTLGWINFSGVSVTLNPLPPVDICTDIPGIQTSVPPRCQTPTPNPGSCIPPGLVWDGSQCTEPAPPPPPPPATPTISSFQASPERVRPGNAATLAWSISNIPGGGCTITKNGAAFASISASQPSGSMSSGAINSQTTFVLTCGSVSATDTVRLIPFTEEI